MWDQCGIVSWAQWQLSAVPEAWDATTGHWGTLVLNDLSLCSATEHFWI